MKIFSLSPNGNGKGTGRMADSATQFCIHKYIVGAVSPPWRGGARVQLGVCVCVWGGVIWNRFKPIISMTTVTNVRNPDFDKQMSEF